MRRWAPALVRGAGLLLLAWILTRVDGPTLGALLDKVDWTGLWGVPLLGLLMMGVRAWRWKLLLDLQKLEMSLWRAGVLYGSGIFLGSLTPGRLGDLAKTLYLRREQGVSWERAAAGVLADRLFDLGVMLLLALWALFHFELCRWQPWMGWAGAGLGLGGWLFAVKGGKGLGGGWSAWLRRQRPWRFAEGMGSEMRGLKGRVGAWALGLTLLAYALYFAQTFLLARAQGLPLSAADVSAALVLVGLASFLPVSVAGLGTREGILIFLLGCRGVPENTEAGVLYSLLFFLSCFVFPAAVGALCWLKEPLPLAELKQRR